MIDYEPKRIGTYKIRAEREPIHVFSEYSNEIHLLSLQKDIVRLIDLFPEPEVFGIFSFIASHPDSGVGKWLTDEVLNDSTHFSVAGPEYLDMEYVFNRSGSKLISMLVKRLIERNDVNESGYYPVTMEQLEAVLQILNARYLTKWNRILSTLREDYDFLQSYAMDYEEDVTDTLTSHSTRKDTGTSTDEADGDSTGYRYTFNTPNDTPVPNDKSDYTDTTSHTLNNDHTEDYQRDNPIKRTIKRSGNIGNITRQELVEKQREVLQWQFFDVIFADIDAVLTRNYYGSFGAKADTRNYKVV